MITPVPDSIPEALGPWNPGIESTIPHHLLPLSTIFRPENVFTSVERAVELRDLTGLEFGELVIFRAERLVLHELLIRVTADFSVSDGSKYEDLGINFRSMTRAILARYLEPNMEKITAAYDGLRVQLAKVIAAELAAVYAVSRSKEGATGGISFPFFGLLRGSSKVAKDAADSLSYQRLADDWEAKANRTGNDLSRAACMALARVVRALYGRHGHSWGTPELIGSLATDLACNDYGSEEIGRLIEPYLLEAARGEGYRRLRAQEAPVVMNTKGPSASGKSTLRPLQKALARRIGVDWNEFALVSPDIWRKQLLDYSSLGNDYRYGGPLASEELAIIDQKLDHHMARKAEQGRMTHLLIDRFRFGSFSPHLEKVGNKLLTRFGQMIYFFFMITPPQAIVERAWKRGLEFGRFKSVDDLLDHSVEAYSGMPQLFLNWAQQDDKPVHYEFLDNSVALGERPRTIAFGLNGEMFVLDVKCMLDAVRFRKVNIDAGGPDQLFTDGGAEAMAPEGNTEFLVQCVRRLREVTFADHETGRIYLRMATGVPVWVDDQALRAAIADPDTCAGILAVAPGLLDNAASIPEQQRFVWDVLPADMIHTLGDWGNEATPPLGMRIEFAEAGF